MKVKSKTDLKNEIQTLQTKLDIALKIIDFYAEGKEKDQLSGVELVDGVEFPVGERAKQFKVVYNTELQ